jgi:GDP-D-mannose 3', 5'-epimerase
MCRHFREDFGVTTRVARFHNVYGPHGTWDGGREKAPAAVCRKVIRAKLSGKHEIEIWGDGHQTRSFMYIDDCLKGTQAIMNSDILEPINLGSNVGQGPQVAMGWRPLAKRSASHSCRDRIVRLSRFRERRL